MYSADYRSLRSPTDSAEEAASNNTLGLDVLHTKTVEGIHDELAMFSIASNVVRLAMIEPRVRKRCPKNTAYPGPCFSHRFR
jgi:hypothetical protein